MSEVKESNKPLGADDVSLVRAALLKADVRVVKMEADYCSFAVRLEDPKEHYRIYKLSHRDAIKAMMDIPIVPFRFFEKECDYSEDPLNGERKIGKEV